MRTILLTLPLALAACDGKPAASPPAPQGPSAFQTQVAALPEAQRNAVFIRAIRDAGQDCQGVTRSEAQSVAAGSDPVWHATCSDKATYAVVIGRDGTATVVAAR